MYLQRLCLRGCRHSELTRRKDSANIELRSQVPGQFHISACTFVTDPLGALYACTVKCSRLADVTGLHGLKSFREARSMIEP